jgi:hypothetical protein
MEKQELDTSEVASRVITTFRGLRDETVRLNRIISSYIQAEAKVILNRLRLEDIEQGYRQDDGSVNIPDTHVDLRKACGVYRRSLRHWDRNLTIRRTMVVPSYLHFHELFERVVNADGFILSAEQTREVYFQWSFRTRLSVAQILTSAVKLTRHPYLTSGPLYDEIVEQGHSDVVKSLQKRAIALSVVV